MDTSALGVGQMIYVIILILDTPLC